ncbi:MAG: hypothetical protein C5B56_11120 [Proteobacteria bacterium]|nr:MAG: hypothetical protein C5B56_11120 [Pseudomonadota bacterium]
MLKEDAVSTVTSHQISDLADRWRGHLARVLAGWRHRKGLALLAKFDDRALADIGLTRADLYDALAQRIWDDPTTMLERRRNARRDSRAQTADSALGRRSPQRRQMLGVAGLNHPPTDRAARYLV